MSIIQIRGTSGSGKSTLMREVMSRYPESVPCMVRPGETFLGKPRKQPYGYNLTGPGGRLFVPGHYETACGGCDTIASLDEIYRLVGDAADAGSDVLFEGLLISPEQRRTLELHQRFPGQVHIIALDVPLAECTASIYKRREARADAQRAAGRKVTERGPVKDKNTEAKHKQTAASAKALAAAGVDVHVLGREAALAKVLELLDLQ